MLQEKNTPEKNFSPREEERIRELTKVCIEELLKVPAPATSISLLKLLEIFAGLTEFYNAQYKFYKVFNQFCDKIGSGTTDEGKFRTYCYLSPITLFLFETKELGDTANRFEALKKSIAHVSYKKVVEGKYNNLIEFYRLLLLYSNVEKNIYIKDLNLNNADYQLVTNLLGNHKIQLSMEKTLLVIDSWHESTRLP